MRADRVMEDAVVSSNRSRTTEVSFAPLGPKVAESFFCAPRRFIMGIAQGTEVK